MARTEAISPMFVVADVSRTIAFYRDRLGFTATYREPEDAPFFAVIARDGAQLMVKSDSDVAPVPNTQRMRSLKWDAYVHTSDPEGLAAEFSSRGAAFHMPLGDTSDGQRGFEIADPDGYVLFFGRPR